MCPEIRIFEDADGLANATARLIAEAASTAIAQRGRFTWVLAGGHTPERAYGLLATPAGDAQVDWAKTYMFFGDERLVPHEDARSNYAMARRALIAPADIAADHVLPIPTNLASPAACAEAYAARLAQFFAVPHGTAAPAFDLVLLGLGDDGHTASLFPGAAALAERRAWVTWSPPGVLPPPVDRVTLTFPVLDAARQVAFLVAGAGKAEALRDVLSGTATIDRRPAAGVRPHDGKLTWLLDEAAARLLSR